jgi:multicomponent Na+:H+ antiporter subunit B
VTSLILRTAARFLLPLLLLFSVFLLFRGHNQPGGGFVGGLVAGSALVLYAISYNVAATRRILSIQPHTLIAFGLLVATVAGVPGLFARQPFLTGRWAKTEVPFLGELPLGTPLLFDVGVYLVVLGATVLIIFPMAEE